MVMAGPLWAVIGIDRHCASSHCGVSVACRNFLVASVEDAVGGGNGHGRQQESHVNHRLGDEGLFRVVFGVDEGFSR